MARQRLGIACFLATCFSTARLQHLFLLAYMTCLLATCFSTPHLQLLFVLARTACMRCLLVACSLGKAQLKKCRFYLGIAQIAIAPPPPSLKRALWGTLFPDRLEQMPFELQFSLHECPKPSPFGQCPNRPDLFQTGASLTSVCLGLE